MQFKGTPRFPANTLDKAIARLGGYWNAYTHLDWTTYFETMPADKIELAIQLEADRMVNSTFDPDEVASERTVVISERQGSENEPVFRLSEAVQSRAFNTHSYRHEVVGDLNDLQSMQRDDLYAHYRTYYNPNNAVLAITGDFETESMLERLRRAYEVIPPWSAAGPFYQSRTCASLRAPGDCRRPGHDNLYRAGLPCPGCHASRLLFLDGDR